MSESEPNSPSSGTFGIPDSHFLRLAVDLLGGLELQSRERGHAALASLVESAKAQAEATLLTNGEGRPDASSEPKLLRLVNAIRSQVIAADQSHDEDVGRPKKRKNPQR